MVVDHPLAVQDLEEGLHGQVPLGSLGLVVAGGLELAAVLLGLHELLAHEGETRASAEDGSASS